MTGGEPTAASSNPNGLTHRTRPGRPPYMERLESINRQLFLLLNADSATSAWAIQLGTAVADLLIYGIPLALAALWLWGGPAQRKAAVQALLVTLVALGLNQAIAGVWPHPRPFVDGIGHQWLAHAPDPSFPSDHMTVFASVGLSLWAAQLAPLAGAVLLCGLAVGWSRVFLGVHYPLDILGGVLVPALTVMLVQPLWTRAAAPVMAVLHAPYRRLFAWPIAKGWTRP